MNNSTPKWVPKHSSDITKLFSKTKELENEFRYLAKKFSTDINLDLLNYYEFQQLVEDCRKCFQTSEELQENLQNQIVPAASKKLQRSAYKSLLQKKAILIAEGLQKRHFQLIFIINKIIKSLLDMSTQSEIILEAALLLSSLYNESIEGSLKASTTSGSKMCSNTYPSLLLKPKKLDIGIILQILCKSRSEHCCLALISCLLATSKIELESFNDDNDSNSSVEILRTLTTNLTSPIAKERDFFHHLTPPSANSAKNNIQQSDDKIICDENEQIIIEYDSCSDPAIKFFDNMAKELLEKTKNGTDEERDLIKCDILLHLIRDEEAFIAHVITKCYKTCPTAIEDYTKEQPDFRKWLNRGTRSLWTQIGSTLDHIVLWWSDAPLACRSQLLGKQLRDWLLLLQPHEAPEPILSTLKGLGETLTTHVTNSIWDQQFRLALVSSTLNCDSAFENVANFKVYIPGTNCGKLWSQLLHNLTNFCNSCDNNGTIPNELPIVEQIPILHRLDHTIHSMRNWAVSRAKFLCSEWNMSSFFKVVHGDIKNCLDNLQELRTPQLVPADTLEVLIQVCVALRSKLVSEVRTNITKLKDTSNECIEILSRTCRTYSLATLTLCFPPPKQWQNDYLQKSCGDYVNYFLNKVYLPIANASRDFEILMHSLKIICEAWLDHIYLKKIRFSSAGAINLLKDFDGVAEWIIECPVIPNEHVERLSKHEVLRMCEGVGKILLRKPEEIVSILPSPKFLRRNDDNNDEKAQLPPEMFVPNQKRWLELRVRSKRKINCISCLCSGIAVEN